MTFGVGLPGFLVACWTPVLAGSPRNCEPRLLLLQMDSPFYVEKQSDEHKPVGGELLKSRSYRRLV